MPTTITKTYQAFTAKELQETNPQLFDKAYQKWYDISSEFAGDIPEYQESINTFFDIIGIKYISHSWHSDKFSGYDDLCEQIEEAPNKKALKLAYKFLVNILYDIDFKYGKMVSHTFTSWKPKNYYLIVKSNRHSSQSNKLTFLEKYKKAKKGKPENPTDCTMINWVITGCWADDPIESTLRNALADLCKGKYLTPHELASEIVHNMKKDYEDEVEYRLSEEYFIEECQDNGWLINESGQIEY